MPPISEITWSVDENGMFAAGPGNSVEMLTAPANPGAGVLLTGPSTAANNYTLTAGFFNSGGGSFTIGYFPAVGIGSLTPLLLNGFTISAMADSVSGGGSSFALVVDGIAAQSMFSTITINGVTYNSSVAIFSHPAGTFTQWAWIPANGLADGGIYNVLIT